MNRFDRLAAILIQLQAKRVVSGPALAEQFGVSLRTVYRDLRSLETAGVPLLTEHAVGYSLVEGYRLPPVLFTREEATALLTAEKLAARLTDSPTARLTGAAMDKLRAVLRRPDRDHLETLAPHIQVLGPRGQPADSTTYQQVVTAIAARRVVRLHYQAGDPAAHSGRAEDAFDVVVPDLPGFGFSAPLPPTGPFADLTARRLHHLMTTTLGYASYGVHGSDVGTLVTECLALNYAPSLSGVHMTGVPFTRLFVPPADPSVAEQDYLTSSRQYLA